MKVYQGSVIDWQRSSEKHHGQCRVCVAAPSWKAAHAIVAARYPITLGYMRSYWTITGNHRQLEAALKNPGRLMVSSSLATDDYKPV